MKYINFFRKDQRGFTLVELLAVIVIIGIVFWGGIKEGAEVGVCAANWVELENQYRVYLALMDVEHSDLIFTTFFNEFSSEGCPVGDATTHSDGHVYCSIHGQEVDEEIDFGNDSGVPSW